MRSSRCPSLATGSPEPKWSRLRHHACRMARPDRGGVRGTLKGDRSPWEDRPIVWRKRPATVRTRLRSNALKTGAPRERSLNGAGRKPRVWEVAEFPAVSMGHRWTGRRVRPCFIGRPSGSPPRCQLWFRPGHVSFVLAPQRSIGTRSRRPSGKLASQSHGLLGSHGSDRRRGGLSSEGPEHRRGGHGFRRDTQVPSGVGGARCALLGVRSCWTLRRPAGGIELQTSGGQRPR